jgi:hypothetical protein
MWIHLAHHYQLAHIPESLTEYRLHPNQASRKKREIRHDNRLWLSKAINSYSIKEIFPELNKSQITSADIAAAYTYLGDVLILAYRQLSLGVGQYLKAWLAWRNLHNPALGRAIASTKLVITEKTQELIQEFRNEKIIQPRRSPPIVLDLRAHSEVIPDIRVAPNN